MGKAVRSLALLCLLCSVWATAQSKPSQVSATTENNPLSDLHPASVPADIIPLDEIHEGMKGTALTVFQGTKPESMDVEVLGVMHNVNGPKGDIILVRLHGTKPEYTGVVAGMSGSPVYFNGRLAGALAFRIGEFSKEPIAGVTPIQEMLEISAMDHRPAQSTLRAVGSAGSSNAAPSNDTSSTNRGVSSQTASPGDAAAPLQSYNDYLKPIDTPLVFNGFSAETLQRYGPQFEAAGIVPVMGIGSSSNEKQPDPIEPGSAVSAVLVRGDMDIAATCTVTYVDPQRLLACGHPLLQFGEVDLPMTKATVLATLPSPMNAFKIVNTTETVGAFVQDRQNGIMGVPGRESKMIPVTVALHSGAATKEFHYEVLNNARLSPLAMMATVFNALHGINEYGEDITYRMNGVLSVKGYPDVTLHNMFAPQDNGQPAAALAAATIASGSDSINETYTRSFARSLFRSAMVGARPRPRFIMGVPRCMRSSVSPSLTRIRSVPFEVDVGIRIGICRTSRSPRYGRMTVSTMIWSPGRASVTSVREASSRAERRSRTRSKSSFTPSTSGALNAFV